MECKILVTGIIRSNNKLLIVKRCKTDRYKSCTWEFPGGKLEHNEMIIDGLIREIKEEVNIDVSNKKIELLTYNEEFEKQGDLLVRILKMIFFIDYNNEDLNVVLSNEHMDYKWIENDLELLTDYYKDLINLIN